MKNYKINLTKKQLKIIKSYWKKMQKSELKFHKKIFKLEKEMEKETKIKDIEFFSCDGEYVGVGNADRSMKLIQLK